MDNSLIFNKYHTAATGLMESEVKNRLVQYGLNELKAAKKTPYIVQFFEEFKDLMVIILIVATIFAFLSGEIVDASIILFIVLLNASIGFAQKFKAEKAIEALKKMVKPYARVRRDGVQKKIAAEGIVPGDILIIEEGDTISADAILFEINELETQESMLTGESTPVEKSAYKEHDEAIPQTDMTENMVFMGTMATHGTGLAIVIHTGMNTGIGRIAALTTETKKDKSPLEKELKNIGAFVGKITLVITAALFGIGFLIQKRELVSTLLFATSVAVAAVPEGLPTTITIALAIGAQRLAKNKAIVKQLSSVETLGATTVICTDKTGTLTKNEMTVKEIYFDRYHGTVKGVGYKPKGVIEIQKTDMATNGGNFILLGESDENLSPAFAGADEILETFESEHPKVYRPFELLMLVAGMCNNASIQEEDNIWKSVGDPTESALVSVVKKSGFDFEIIKNRYEKIHEFPFDATRKRMSIIVKDTTTEKMYVFSKGAPSSISAISTHVILNNNTMVIDRGTTADFVKKNEEMASKGLRCLGFAYKELSHFESKKLLAEHEKGIKLKKEEIETGLTFLGLVGMADPPRSDVKEAIELTHRAGIKVYIVTGDHGLTAEAIARQIGLLKDKYQIILGETLEKMSNAELKKLLSDKDLEIIFARVSPEHKLRVVSTLKELGEVVAVTGDGVNDAPALKRADIGVAMGISGTDVAKEASNMILSDDSFSTIVTAVKEGRTIYENLKKFVFYIFSTNFGELFIIFAAILLNLPTPLTAILILFINLTTDILPALALGIEQPEHDVMHKKPRNVHQKILNKALIMRLILSGSTIGIIVTGMYLWNLSRFGWTFQQLAKLDPADHVKGITMAFVLLTTLEMANAFNARSEHRSIFKIPFFSNPKLLWAIASSLLLTVLIVEVPILQNYLHTTGLNTKEWLLIGMFSLLIIGVEELRKLVVKQHAY